MSATRTLRTYKPGPKIHVYDSFLGEEYPMHSRYASIYEPMWQCIRLQTHFHDSDEMLSAVAVLEAYLGLAPEPVEYVCRIFRVRILLCAIPIGQIDKTTGLPNVKREVQRMVLEYRAMIEKRAQVLPPIMEWDWHVVRCNLRNLLRNEPDSIYEMYVELTQNRARRARPKLELRHFLTMIEEVTDDNSTN